MAPPKNMDELRALRRKYAETQRQKKLELLKTVEVPESAPRIELSEVQPEPAPEPLKGDEGAEPGDAPIPAEEEKPKVSEAEARPLQLGWRLRARRDLLFLLRSVLRYRDVTPEVHGPIIEAMQKFEPSAEGEMLSAEGVQGYEPKVDLWALEGGRKRLVLFPRGHL